MGKTTRISWTDCTFNAWWGCTKVSDACDHCYSEALAKRCGYDIWGKGKPRLILSDKNWAQPLRWNAEAAREGKTVRVFSGSMCDVMDDEAPDGERDRLWELINATPHLTWQLLTKRPQRFSRYLPELTHNNVWLGVSAEDQENYDLRWPLLRQVAGERDLISFVSYEPACGPLVLSGHPTGPDWIICGGESGASAKTRRVLPAAWVENLLAEIREKFPARTPSMGAQLIPAHLLIRRFPGETFAQISPVASVVLNVEPETEPVEKPATTSIVLYEPFAAKAEPVEPETKPIDQPEVGQSVADPQGWPVLLPAALYGLPGDVVRTIEPRSEADPTAILIQTLAAIGNLLGPGPYCSVESTRHALNIYTLFIGESSRARKGTSWDHIMRLCSRVDGLWAQERVTSGLSSAEGLISKVQDTDPPSDRRLLVVQSEFASVLKIMRRAGNTLSPLLRAAWDNGNLRTLVKSNPLKATNAHISIIGHITSPELLRNLSDGLTNGFANRLLWCCIKRSKFLPEGGSVPEAEIASLSRRLRVVLEWAWSGGNFELRRDNAARDLWAAVYPSLSACVPGSLGAATRSATM
jgi:protein gp37